MVLVKQSNSQADGMEAANPGLNHSQRPQMLQRCEQHASKRCPLKLGKAETMAAHFQLPESTLLFTLIDGFGIQDED